jgi:AcrR family transcriptional regulator
VVLEHSAAALSRIRENSREQVREMQRRRLLDAMAQLLVERSFRGLTAGSLATRADVSPPVLRDLFGSLDGCFLVLLEQVLERSTTLVIAAFEREASWEDGVLAGLEALLVFLDSEPALARVCLVEAHGGPPAAMELRARLLAVLTPLLERARERLAVEEQPPSLTAAATIAAVAGILQEQLVVVREPVFVGLLGELCGVVVAPYLGVLEARVQIERGNARAAVLIQELKARPARVPVPIPKELRHASADRMRLSLAHIAAHPGDSNQGVAEGIDLSHHGQMSKTLSRLYALELLVKQPGGAGRPNAWRLTPYGEQVAMALER